MLFDFDFELDVIVVNLRCCELVTNKLETGIQCKHLEIEKAETYWTEHANHSNSAPVPRLRCSSFLPSSADAEYAISQHSRFSLE